MTPTRVHRGSLLLSFPVLLWLGRGMWFHHDDWAFVLGHVGEPRPQDVFAPYDIHWTTVITLIYRAMSWAFGARTYLPYVALTIAVHLVVSHLLWRVLLRCGVRPWLATGAVAVFLVLGAGSQAMLWGFAISYTIPLALGLGNVVLATADAPLTRRRLAAMWVRAILGLMCSGVGIAMIALPVVCLAFRDGPRRAITFALVPAVVYLLWLFLTSAAVFHKPGGASAQTSGGSRASSGRRCARRRADWSASLCWRRCCSVSCWRG